LARQNELQADFQAKLQAFLKKERGLKDEELPRCVFFYFYELCCSINCFLTSYSFFFISSAIGFQDLLPALREEVKELQKRMSVELQPLVRYQVTTTGMATMGGPAKSSRQIGH
jgi:hypothetical protein